MWFLGFPASETICLFSLVITPIAPSDNVQASPQGGGVLVSSSSNPPCPLCEVCGVFVYKILPPGSGRQAGAMIITYVCESFGLSVNGFLYLVLNVLLLSGGALLSHMT